MATIAASAWETWDDMHPYSRTMLLIAVISKLFLVLQISVIIANGSSDNTSFSSYLILFIASLFWLLYGLHNENTILVTASYIGTLGSLIAMIVVVLYKRNKSNLL